MTEERPDFRRDTAAQLRELAARTEDEKRAAALLDTAAEYDALSLNGAAAPREAA